VLLHFKLLVNLLLLADLGRRHERPSRLVRDLHLRQQQKGGKRLDWNLLEVFLEPIRGAE
jgi:hypothetical protein